MTKTTESKAKYKHACKRAQHITDETRIGTIEHRYKTSSIFPIYIFGKVNEAFFDEKQVHNLPFGLINVGGRK
jgi:hypothetical protein